MEKILITNSKYDLKYDYYITDDGRLYSGATNKFLSTQLDKDGYVKCRMISSDGKRHRYSIHRLMMENFYPREDMDQLQVNHIDGNKQNNNLNNLEWTTPSENTKHAFSIGLKTQQGVNNNACKYSEETILKAIEMLLSKKYSGAEIDRQLGFCKDYANSIRRKERWTHLTKDIDFN